MSDLPPFARFWMVCRKPSGDRSKTEPRQRYSDHGDARRAAQKLATENDHPFLVLEAVEIFRPEDDAQGALI